MFIYIFIIDFSGFYFTPKGTLPPPKKKTIAFGSKERVKITFFLIKKEENKSLGDVKSVST